MHLRFGGGGGGLLLEFYGSPVNGRHHSCLSPQCTQHEEEGLTLTLAYLHQWSKVIGTSLVRRFVLSEHQKWLKLRQNGLKMVLRKDETF